MAETKLVLDSENRDWCTFIRRNARRYANHIPLGTAHFGTSIDRTLHDRATIYREGRLSSKECVPVTISRPDPPILVQPDEIYHKHVGMIPNYLGHVPGAVFRYGKTFEVDTRDAKRWLQRDPIL